MQNLSIGKGYLLKNELSNCPFFISICGFVIKWAFYLPIENKMSYPQSVQKF